MGAVIATVRQRVSAVSIAVLALLCSTPTLAAGDNDAAAHLFAIARAATGGAAWDRNPYLHVTVKRQSGDETANEELWLDIGQGRMASSIATAAGQSRQGFDGHTTWSEAPDKPPLPTDPDARQSLITEAFWQSYQWVRPLPASISVDSVKIQTRGGHDYDMVRLVPVGGRALELWFDRATHLPAIVVVPLGRHDETIRFADWRKTRDITTPWRIDISHGADEANPPVRLSVTDLAKIAPPEAPYFQMPAASVDVVFPRNAASVETPIRIVNDHVFIQGKINKTRMLLRVDSAGTTSFDRDFAHEAGLETDSEQLRVPEFTVGGIVLRRQPVLLRDLTSAIDDEGIRFEGILGGDVLRNLVSELDYEGRRLVFVKAGGFVPPPSAIAVPMVLSPSGPVIDVRLDGVTAGLVVDTAANAGLTITRNFVQAHGLAGKWRTAPAIVDDGTAAVPAELAHAKSLELGVFGIAQPLAMIVADTGMDTNGTDGILGGAILRHFDLIFDYPHGHILLQENGNASWPDVVDRAGLCIVADKSVLKVAGIVAAGPAARAGLKPGDLIQSVDGAKIGASSLPSTRLLLTGTPGSGISFGIDRDGVEKSVRLILADPLATPADAQ